MFLFLLVAKFHEIGLDEIVDATIHHPLYVGGLVVGAVVFDPTVVEHITAYLRPPFDFLLAGLDLGLPRPYGAATPSRKESSATGAWHSRGSWAGRGSRYSR